MIDPRQMCCILSHMLYPSPAIASALANLSAEERRWLIALSHLDNRTIRRCASGLPVRSSCLARVTEALTALRATSNPASLASS